METNKEQLEREILRDAGRDMARDYELLRHEDFAEVWGI